jgi:hypothetical protein
MQPAPYCPPEGGQPSKEVGGGCDAVQRREYLDEHPGECTGGICTPRKPKDAYLVSVLIYSDVSGRVASGGGPLSRTILHQKFVSSWAPASVHFERTKNILVYAPWV